MHLPAGNVLINLKTMEYFAFQWHITDTCDQRCRHCYIFSVNNHFNLKEMSWTQIESVFENCNVMCKKANRIPYFYITGGDPILHSHFWDLMELFRSHNIAFTILGNPFHLNDEVCRKLKEYGCERYQLSIDGLRETHDSMRKKGSFDTTIEKLKCLHKAGIRSAIMTTVSGLNAVELPSI
jgi:MoaA/NifB/PqqE/SkfB family radical SAM enzyme